ncbi:d-importin 7/ranbp7 [Anaeramoeba flamelloides]|uniref:D-importin 7/ranbp7 n=1 Tax=Anaeramoeba flamelloides TaxID=1746091 RepID=A0AAV8A8P2_9EUKA|nr:d-importin 7/ranbp7 [Anaeramoeba flamelloides]
MTFPFETLFLGTISTNVEEQKESEFQLTKLRLTSNFYTSLLNFTVNKSIQEDVRLAGTLFLKNSILRQNSINQENQKEQIPEEEMDYICENMVIAISETSGLIRSHHSFTLQSLILSSFPERMPNLMDKCQELSQANEIGKTHAVLQVIRYCIKKYQQRAKRERKPLLEIIQHFFPSILELFIGLIQLLTEKENYQLKEILLMCKMIIKMFSLLLSREIPEEIREIKVFNKWFECFHRITEIVPQNIKSIQQQGNMDQNLWIKCKKWTTNFFFEFFCDYCEYDEDRKGYTTFLQWFRGEPTKKLIELELNYLLYNKELKECLSPKIMVNILLFFERSFGNVSTYNLLEPYLIEILQNAILPLFLITENDLDLWKNSPEMYLYEEFDEESQSKSPRIIASQILQTLIGSECEKKNENLDLLLKFIERLLNENENENENESKNKNGGGDQVSTYHAAFYIMGTISQPLIDSETHCTNLENFLIEYVFPRFESNSGFLRARACWLGSKFSQIIWDNNQQNLDLLFKKVIGCLFDDELPVQVYSAVSLQHILPLINELEIALENNFKDILNKLLILITESGVDEIVITLNLLIQLCNNNIHQYSLELVEYMKNIFLDYIKLQSDEDEDSSYLYFSTSRRALTSICTIIASLRDNEKWEILFQIPELLLPIFQIFSQIDQYELFEQIFPVLNLLIHSLPINNTLLYSIIDYFPQLVGMAPELMEEVGETIYHFAEQGLYELFDYEDNMYLELILKLIINTISFDVQKEQAFSTSHSNSCKLAISLIILATIEKQDESKIPLLDQFINQIFNIILMELNKTKVNNTYFILLNVLLMSCIYYDAELIFGKIKEMLISVNQMTNNNSEINELNIIENFLLLLSPLVNLIEDNQIKNANLIQIIILALSAIIGIICKKPKEYNYIEIAPNLFKLIIKLLIQSQCSDIEIKIIKKEIDQLTEIQKWLLNFENNQNISKRWNQNDQSNWFQQSFPYQLPTSEINIIEFIIMFYQTLFNENNELAKICLSKFDSDLLEFWKIIN